LTDQCWFRLYNYLWPELSPKMRSCDLRRTKCFYITKLRPPTRITAPSPAISGGVTSANNCANNYFHMCKNPRQTRVFSTPKGNLNPIFLGKDANFHVHKPKFLVYKPAK
jgi:hypothetical protein